MNKKIYVQKTTRTSMKKMKPGYSMTWLSFLKYCTKSAALAIFLILATLSSGQNTSAFSTPTDQTSCEAAGGTWNIRDNLSATNTSTGSCSGATLGASLSLENQVNSFLYYRQLGTCLVDGGPNLKDGAWFDGGERITRQHASSGEWFNQASAPGGTALKGINGIQVKTDGGGSVDCAQTGLVNGALNLWDNWAPDEALCAMGMRSASDAEFNAKRCTSKQGATDEFRRDDNMLNSFRNAIKNRVYGGKEPSVTANPAWNDAGNYILNLRTFTATCVQGASITQTPPTGSTDRDFKLRTPSRSPDGKKIIWTTTYYTGQTNKSQGDGAVTVAGSDLSRLFGQEGSTCGGLMKAINGNDNQNDGLADKYAAWLLKNATQLDNAITPQDPTTTVDSKTSCGIEGLGWIVCPAMNFIASITDNAFNFLSSTFLETKASVLGDPAVRSAWSSIRNIANVAFVIAFLFIIFSQLTGQGVSNYGVKKMLPRLVIAAILVNASFFICQIAVDISNILGYSLNGILKNGFGVSIGGNISGADASNNPLGIAALIAGIVAGTVTILLAVTMPVLLAVLLALLMIVLILVARTALIILLTIIAPLAFVAYLLPNTEQWFKKWYKMYFALLMVFPIIAVVFGASTLAAYVIKSTSGDDPFMKVVAIGVAALPLFIVPSLLKGSLNAAGSIGTKLSGISSKLNGRIGKNVQDTSKLGQLGKYRAQQAQIRRAQILGGTFKGNNKNPLNWTRNLESAANNQINQRTGKFGTEQSRLGERINAKIEAEEVTAAKATIDKLGLNPQQLTELAKGNTISHEGRAIKSDHATQKAAISSVVQMGDHNETRKLIDSVGNSQDTALRVHLADSLASSSARPGYIGGAALGAIKTGSGVNTTKLAKNAVEAGVYSADKIAKGDKDELGFIAQVVNDTTDPVSLAAHQRLVDSAHTALTDRELSLVVGKNRDNIEHIRTNTTP